MAQLPGSVRLLDVGCGSASPLFVKELRPDIYYVGVDVGDYCQTEESKAAADEYVISDADTFAEKILQLGEVPFDAVISAHNIEHCLHPDRVLVAMCRALKPGGRLFLSFPSEASTRLPSRAGTLNFYDDPTHRTVPVWQDVLRTLTDCGMEIDFSARRYRPWAAVLLGLAFEPFVAPFKRMAPRGSTWALYGFESVVWAHKR